MSYAKITVKSNYEKRGDLVLRSYVRGLQKIEAMSLLDNDKAYIYGVVDQKGVFHELFTKQIIDFDEYVEVPIEECSMLTSLPNDLTSKIYKITQCTLFDCDMEFDFEISTMEELANDRKVEFDAYDMFLSRINPYQRLENNPQGYNDYNSFSRKIEEIKKMRELDQRKPSYDEYEVVENPKKLTKRK